MSPLLERWIRRVTLAACDGDRAAVRRASSHMPYLSVRERAWLERAGIDAMRKIKASRSADRSRYATSSAVQNDLEKAANALDRKLQTKAKAVRVTEALEKGRGDCVVFYGSTYHQKPADGHKDWQGKTYVDRYWRRTLRDGGREDLIPEVGKRIAEEGIPTVQWAMGAPVWLVTRPYCRHALRPIPTEDALNADDLADYPKGKAEFRDHAHRSLTDAQRYARKKARRLAIRARLREKEKAA